MASPTKSLVGAVAIDVTVVTPRGEVAHTAVNAITARGSLGEFEVLPGHIPFLTMLETGVLILGEGADRTMYAVGPGYLAVGATGRAEVLVEQAIEASKVDVDGASEQLAELEAQLKALEQTGDAEWKNLVAKRDWVRAQLEADARS